MSIRAYGIGRNGMPERIGYVYRGTGEDQGPLTDADLEPYKVDYSHWLPSFERGNRAPREAPHRCGYKWNSQNCRALCGGAR